MVRAERADRGETRMLVRGPAGFKAAFPAGDPAVARRPGVGYSAWAGERRRIARGRKPCPTPN